MSSLPKRAAILALLLGAVLTTLGAGPPEEPAASPARPAEPTEQAAVDGPEDEAARRATAGGADLPVGVTLHGPRPPAAIAREQLEPGVTLHGPAPQVTWPRLTYRIPDRPAPPTTAGPVPPFALAAPGRPSLRPPGPVVALPRLPDPGSQLAPPAPPPRNPWTPFPESVDWVPQPAYDAADPGVPYPWNPVRWSGEDGIEREWLPVPAWPAGVDAENWSPVLWSSPPAWTSWRPRDSWGRPRDAGDGASRREDAPVPPAPDSPQD